MRLRLNACHRVTLTVFEVILYYLYYQELEAWRRRPAERGGGSPAKRRGGFSHQSPPQPSPQPPPGAAADRDRSQTWPTPKPPTAAAAFSAAAAAAAASAAAASAAGSPDVSFSAPRPREETEMVRTGGDGRQHVADAVNDYAA